MYITIITYQRQPTASREHKNMSNIVQTGTNRHKQAQMVSPIGYFRAITITIFQCQSMRRSRNFCQGGGGVQVRLTKKSSDLFFFVFFFFSPQLILQKSNGQFQRNLSFFKVPEGVQHFPGGSNCLFPIETHITCDFLGGGGGGVRTPASPPSLWIYTCKEFTLW